MKEDSGNSVNYTGRAGESLGAGDKAKALDSTDTPSGSCSTQVRPQVSDLGKIKADTTAAIE